MSRVRALGPAETNVDLTSIAPKLRTHQPSFLPLTSAIESRNQVSFSYRKPDQDASEIRTVQPWQLYQVGSQWILVCFDVDRNDLRNFLLKRITSKVTILDEKFKAPTALELQEAKARLDEHTEKQVATVRVQEGGPAWVHFDLSSKGTLDHSIKYMDLHLLAEELRELGPDLEVLNPVELKDAIQKGLERVANDHA
jgi:predicted DNA-binding transcriptional regulator YafY